MVPLQKCRGPTSFGMVFQIEKVEVHVGYGQCCSTVLDAYGLRQLIGPRNLDDFMLLVSQCLY